MVLVQVLLRPSGFCCAQEVIQGPRRAESRGGGVSIITDGVESVHQHRYITGTSRCMQGNFSPAPCLGGGAAGVQSRVRVNR